MEGLRGLYERYCDQEARRLLSLVPREGLRAIYASARGRRGGEGEVADPMALAVRRARELLPLPPFERWLDAYLHDRRPFLEALGVAPVPERGDPVLVDVRPAGPGWMAELHLAGRAGDWRGFVRFSPGLEDECATVRRTADIFRGDDPAELRRRFREFSAATLAALLRSVSP